MSNNPFNKSTADSVTVPNFKSAGIGAPKVNIKPNENKNQRVGLNPSSQTPDKQAKADQFKVEQPKQVDQSWAEYKAALEERVALAQPVKTDQVEVEKSWVQSMLDMLPEQSSELNKDIRESLISTSRSFTEKIGTTNSKDATEQGAMEQKAAPSSESQNIFDRMGNAVENDYTNALAKGFVGVVGTGGDLYGLFNGDMDNWGTKFAKDNKEYLSERDSEELQLLNKAKQSAIDKADGEINKFFTSFKETVSEPKLFTLFLVEQVPTLITTGGVGRGAALAVDATAAAAKKLSSRAASKITKKGVAKASGGAAVAGAISAGALMQGADSGSEAYKDLLELDADGLAWASNEAYKKLISDGVSDKEARKQVSLEAARLSAIRSGVISLGVNSLLPSGTAIERMVTGTLKQGGGGIVKGAAKGFAGEAVVEGIDEGFGKLSSNMGVREVDKSRGLTEGVGQAASEGAMFGVMGGVAGGLQGRSTPETRKRDAQQRLAQEIESNIANANTGDPTVDAALSLDPNQGSISRAARKGAEQAATEITINKSVNTAEANGDTGQQERNIKDMVGSVVELNGRSYEVTDQTGDSLYQLRDTETGETYTANGNEFYGDGGIGNIGSEQDANQYADNQQDSGAPYTEGQKVDLSFSESGEGLPAEVISYENGELMVRGEDGDAYLVTDEDVANGEVFISPTEQTDPAAKYEGASIDQLEQAINDIDEASRDTGLTQAEKLQLAEIEKQLLQRFAEEDAAAQGETLDNQTDAGDLKGKATSELVDWAERIEAYTESNGESAGRSRVLSLINEELDARYSNDELVNDELASDELASDELASDEAPENLNLEPEQAITESAEVEAQEQLADDPVSPFAEQEPTEAPTPSEEAKEPVAARPTVPQNSPDEEAKAEIKEFVGKDGKPKWFGSKPKANQFIEKKGIADTHEVRKSGNRWEIHAKPQQSPKAVDKPTENQGEQKAGRSYTPERLKENLNKIFQPVSFGGKKREQAAKAFAGFVGITNKRKGETTQERLVRFRKAKETLQELSNTDAKELYDNNTLSELKDMGAVLGIGNSRSTKANLSRELSEAPDKVWAKLANEVDTIIVSRRVVEQVQSNKPVSMADVLKISNGVGTLWTTNDAAVGHALGLDEVQPQGSRGEREGIFDRFAEITEAHIDDDNLSQYLFDNQVDREIVESAVNKAKDISNFEMAGSLLGEQGAEIARQINLPRELGASISELLYFSRNRLLDAYPKAEPTPTSNQPDADQPTSQLNEVQKAQDTTVDVTPMHDWRGDLIKSRDYANKLREAGRLGDKEVKDAWRSAEALTELIDSVTTSPAASDGSLAFNSKGKPFTSEKTARIISGRRGYKNATIVPVDGGFAINRDSITPPEVIAQVRESMIGKIKEMANLYPNHDLMVAGRKYELLDKVKKEVSGEALRNIAKVMNEALPKAEREALFEDSKPKAGTAPEKPVSKLDSASTAISAKKLEAAQKLKKLIDSRKGNLNSGVDPEVMIAVAEVGALSVAEGAVKFAQYVRDVIATTRAVGIDDADVKPFIKESYGAIQSNPAKYGLSNDQVDAMDAPREFRDLDVESIVKDLTKSPDMANGATITAPKTNETKEATNDGAKRSDRNGRGSDELQSRASTPKQEGTGKANATSGQERGETDSSADKKRNESRDRGKRSLQGRDESASLNLNKVDGLAEGTGQQRVQANLDAIRLMKDLTSSKRKPTLSEKETLAKYVGWGGLSFVFDTSSNRKYAQDANAELKSLLTETEYNNIRESTRNAFYTSGDVVNAMWKGVEAFGLGKKKMNALEPSLGTGNFIGFQPESMRDNTKWSGAELDTVTGNIAKLIYPESNIQVRGFQDTPFKQNAFSLAIGNPPFGSQSISDSKMKDISGMSVHNYVIAKSGKLLHENGLLMMVVTSRFLDTKNKNHSELSKSLEFIGAVRLPNTAFKQNAGTEVTTDIVVFRKLAKGEQSKNLVWTDTEGAINGTKINKWFELNPSMVLGEVSNQGSMYRSGEAELTVNPTSEHTDLGASIERSLAQLAEGNTVTQTSEQIDMAAGEVLLTESDLAIGGMMLNEEGKVVRRAEDDLDGSAKLEEITKDTVWMYYGESLESASAVLNNKPALEEYVGENLVSKTGKIKAEYTNSKIKKAAFDAVMDVMTGKKTPAQAKPYIDAAINQSRLGEKQFNRVKGLMQLRNTALELIRAERQDRPNIESLRKRLNTQYDKFIKENSTRQSKASVEKYLNLLNGDYGIESGLDSVSKSGKVKRHDIFTKRMVYPYKAPTSADNIDDAVTYSIQNRGVIDVGYIAELRGQSAAEVRADLTKGDRPYLLTDPALGEDVFIDDYLSGNVKRKLQEAESAGLDVNAKLLREVQPKDKPMSQVKPSIRAGWIDSDIYDQYLSALGVDAKVTVNRELGLISTNKSARKIADTELSAPFKHDRASIPQLFDAAATGKSIVVYDGVGKERTKNEKATKEVNALSNKMAESFKVWAESDPNVHQRIADNFNDRLNGYVTRRYNGRLHLRPVGQNPTIDLRSSQLNVAMRMIQSKNVLMDHTVGTGKSYSAITGMMERKRLGLSKKPLMAVPNHIIGSMAKDFYKLYPASNILVASEKSFSAKNRKQFFARVATGDYDAIIIGHSHLRAIQNSLSMYEDVINEKISELREALESAKKEAKESGARGSSVKQIEGSISTLKNKIKDRKEALEKGGDKTGFTFEDLGVDYLSIDESHTFKNLTYATKSDRVVGMNDPAGSEMALDALIKTRAIQKLDNGGVTFMTGTPISNSLVEVYTTMYYLGHEQLKDMKISAYDAFAGSFINTEIAMEYTPTGTVKERRVLKGLNNLQELSTLYQQFADVITNEDMKDIYKEDVEARNAASGGNESTRYPIPSVKDGGRQLDIASATESQREYNDYLIARMEAIESITGRQERLEYAKTDNPLWVLTDAKKASLDVRLIDPTLERDPTGKVARAADNIMRLYKSTDADKGTQLVFSDMGTPAKHAKGSVRKDLISLGKYVMTEKKSREFVNQRAELYEDNVYGRTLADISELIDMAIASGEVDGGAAESSAELINSLEASTLTADTGFSVYDDLKVALEEKGIPSEEIAFIHDYPTADKKAGLFEQVNSGEIRVLIGSSAKMGAGTNAQERLVGLHHMDAPWRPSDMEQREGRIIRQGNKLYERAVLNGDPESFQVEITAYATQGSSDPVMWQILERKSRSIEQFRNGALDEFTEQGGDSDSYAEFKAASTGNPVYKMKLASDANLLNAESDYTAKAASKSAAERQIREFEPRIKALKGRLESLTKAQKVNFNADSVRQAIKSNLEEFNKEVDAYELANNRYDEMTPAERKAKKVTRPTKPVRKPLHLLDNDYSKALNESIMQPAIKAMSDDRPWAGKLKLGESLTLAVDMTPLDGGIHDVTVSYQDGNGTGVIVPSRYHLKTMTGSNSLMDSLTLPSIIGDISREAKRQQAVLDAAIKNKPTYEKLAKAKITKELGAYEKAQAENLWLMVEAGLADIKESIRRSKTSNRFIDKETKRNVKRSTFNASDIKPQDFTFDGKKYKALGVSIPSNHWAYSHLMPALDTNNEYVHLKVDREAGKDGDSTTVVEVMTQPEGMPSPDISFLGASVPSSKTANFKRWFGNSKAVDAQGNPQVLYHGTRADFTEFKPSKQTGGLIFFTTEPSVAGEYASSGRTGYTGMGLAEDQVIADLTSKSNPELFAGKKLKPTATKELESLLDVLHGSDLSGVNEIATQLSKSAITPAQAVNQYNNIIYDLFVSGSVMPVNARIEKPANTPETPVKWREAEKISAEGYKKQGFDGVYVTEGDGVALAVFDANQIKSAVGNTGEYSLTDDNIMLSLSEKVGEEISVTGAVLGQAISSKKSMSKAKAQEVADQFIERLDDNLKLKVRVFDTQLEAYGEDANPNRMVPIMGGYHPEVGVASIIAGNHSTPAQVRETLRHEVFGHYGLDTFPKRERDEILDKIIDSKEHKSLKPLWDQISNSEGYAAMTERGKAEEVFAHIAEVNTNLIRTIADIIFATINRASRFLGLTKATITRSEARRIVASVAKGVRNGQRQQLSRAKKGDNFKRVGEELPQPPSDQEVGGWFSNKFTDSMKHLLATAPMDRMIIEMGSKVPALSGYLQVKRTMDAYRNRKHGVYNDIAQRWLDLKVKHPVATKKLANIMHQSTLNQVDPSKPFVSNLTQVERMKAADGVIGEELAERIGKDKDRRDQYEKIKRAYDSLPELAQDMYNEVRDTYEHQADEYDSILIDNIDRALEAQNARSEEAMHREINEIKAQDISEDSKAEAMEKAGKKHIARITKLKFNKAARLAMMRKQFESNRIEAPYFPLARFGDYFVTLRNEEGETVSFSLFETESEQKKFAAESRKEGYKVDSGVMAERDKVQSAVNPNFLVDVNEILEESGVGDSVKDQVWQKYLESLPDLSMRKRRIHRKGQAGYEQDALRAFSSQMFHSAHQMARMKYAPEMDAYLKEATEEAKKTNTANRDTLVVNEVIKRQDYVMNPKGSAGAQRLTSAAFVYYLGMSPASAIVNMAQTVIVGIPMLSNSFGFMASQAQLIRALKDFTVGKGQAINGNLTTEEKQAIERAYDAGVIDKTQGHDLAGVGESGVNYSPVRTKVMGAVSWAFHHTERLNREVTFLAAYRLAKRDGKGGNMNTSQAQKAATEMVWKTHFDYSNTNRPRVMHGDAAKVALVFRNYQVNMLFRLFRDTHQALNGETKEAKREARYQLGAITGMMAMNAGVRGTWMYGMGMMLASLFFGGGDDVEDVFIKGVQDNLPPWAASLLLDGVGGSIAGASVSERIGMPDLWFRSPSYEMEGRDEYNYWLGQMLGAVPSIIEKQVMGINLIAKGEFYRGTESMAPNLIKNPMKAYRYSQEGVTNLNDIEMLSTDDLSHKDILIQALGFTPAIVGAQYDRNNAIRNAESRIKKERSKALGNYSKAYLDGDSKKQKEAINEILEFNSKNPTIQITNASVKQSVKGKDRRRKQADGGIVVDKRVERELRDSAPRNLYKDND